MPLDLPAFSVNPAAVKVVDAAIAYVRDDGHFNDERYGVLVKAVAEYCATNDPDAAKRNRDEHGPDIPTQDLDWRMKL